MTSRKAATVAELIAALSDLPQDATVFSTEPPFNGVNVIPQQGGAVMIAPLPRETGEA